jgi:hypothetical protein
MQGTMRGVAITVALLLAAAVLTGLLASSLQQRAMSKHPVAETYSPDRDAETDRFGWPVPPKNAEGRSRSAPDESEGGS